MFGKIIWRRPILTVTQFVILLLVSAGLFVALDLNRRAQSGRLVGADAGVLQAELDSESTREVQLQATLSYVQSDAYVGVYARNEGGLLLPGEKRIVPLVAATVPAPTPVAVPTVDPATYARPWQAWWQLLTDAPLPSE